MQTQQPFRISLATISLSEIGFMTIAVCWFLLTFADVSMAAPADAISHDDIELAVTTDSVLEVYSDIQRLRLSNPAEPLSLTIGERTINLPAADLAELRCTELVSKSAAELGSSTLRQVGLTIHMSLRYAHSVVSTELAKVALHASNSIASMLPHWASDLAKLIP